MSTVALNIDPKHVFNQACCFYYASRVLGVHAQMRIAHCELSNKPISIPTSVPSVVTSAFSLELFLKCLYLLSNQSFDHIHGLKLLFEKLQVPHKQGVQNLYDSLKYTDHPSARPVMPLEDPHGVKYPADHYDLNNVLERINSAFTKWRYAFEDYGILSYSGHSLFETSIHEYILTLKPEWKSVEEQIGPLPIMNEPQS